MGQWWWCTGGSLLAPSPCLWVCLWLRFAPLTQPLVDSTIGVLSLLVLIGPPLPLGWLAGNCFFHYSLPIHIFIYLTDSSLSSMQFKIDTNYQGSSYDLFKPIWCSLVIVLDRCWDDAHSSSLITLQVQHCWSGNVENSSLLIPEFRLMFHCFINQYPFLKSHSKWSSEWTPPEVCLDDYRIILWFLRPCESRGGEEGS